MVPISRILFTLIPAALANMGLAPAALMAIPVLERIKTHTRKHIKKKNRRRPVGTSIPNRENARVSFITPLKEEAREMVFRRPLPALGQISSPLSKGRSIHSIFIKAMMENPT